MIKNNPDAGGRMERKKEATQQKIIVAAMDLIRLQSFDGTTMEQIAEAADIAKGTLYHYFPVKEAILSEYIRRSFQANYSRRVSQLRGMPDTRTRMTAVLNELMEGIRAQREIFEKYLVYQIQNMLSLRRDEGIKSGFDEIGAEIIVLGQESGELRSDIPREILIALFGFAFIEVAQEFYRDPEHCDLREVVEQCVDLFINGARPT